MSPIRSSGGGGAASSTSGARLTPQLPVTTVVTPWLALAAISGVANSARSSWVCTSMKPGETILPATSISRAFAARVTTPTAATRSPIMAMSARRLGPPRPSTTSPPRRIQSVISRPLSQYAILPYSPPNTRRIGDAVARGKRADHPGGAGHADGQCDAKVLDPGGAGARDQPTRRPAGARAAAGRGPRRLPRHGGLLDEYCPHRRASLFFGRNEECGLRCVYH